MQHTRRVVLPAAAICSLALALTLSGCGSSAGGSLTVDSAKQHTISMEKLIASYVPKSKVLSTNITTKSRVIFPCLGKNGKSYWPGSATLRLKSGVDTDAVFAAIAQKWNGTKGWSAYIDTDSSGSSSLALKTGDGYSFTAEFDQGPVFSITALSACFDNAGLSGKSSY
jgi:hypothetical protein